ncbi:hypothetical protein FQZ97_1014480 [compost metagenome]
MVAASCLASESRRSRRTSLCTLPRALVLVPSPVPLVSVPPRITLDWVRSHQSIISLNAAGSPWAALRNSISMPIGMMPAALCPSWARARSRVNFSFSVAPPGYLPTRMGMP